MRQLAPTTSSAAHYCTHGVICFERQVYHDALSAVTPFGSSRISLEALRLEAPNVMVLLMAFQGSRVVK